MNPTMPAARWQPANIAARRPIMGQAQPLLNITVTKDGKPLAGAELEVMFADGSSRKGVTAQNGILAVPYTSAQIGQTVVLLTQPEGVEELGEGLAQGVNLQGGAPASVAFALKSVAAEPNALIGLGIGALLYGLALT